MMMISTKVRLESDPRVFFMMLNMSLRDFHDLASLNTLRSLNDLSMESPFTPSARSSTIERTTMTKSKSLALSYNQHLTLCFTKPINSYGKEMSGSHGKQLSKGFKGKYCSEEKISIKQQAVQKWRPEEWN